MDCEKVPRQYVPIKDTYTKLNLFFILSLSKGSSRQKSQPVKNLNLSKFSRVKNLNLSKISPRDVTLLTKQFFIFVINTH